MSIWVAVKQALVVMDAVERSWGRALGLEGSEVMMFLMLARRPGRSVSDVAFLTGRQRQHVWRSMRGLAKRGLVHPTRTTTRGAAGWSLTPEGLTLARRLEVRLAAYETIMGSSVDLPMVAWSLQRMVETVVNRPSASGWRRGLVVPQEQRLDPNWDAHLAGAVLPPTAENPDSVVRRPPGERSAAELEAIARAWRALWN